MINMLEGHEVGVYCFYLSKPSSLSPFVAVAASSAVDGVVTSLWYRCRFVIVTTSFIPWEKASKGNCEEESVDDEKGTYAKTDRNVNKKEPRS